MWLSNIHNPSLARKGQNNMKGPWQQQESVNPGPPVTSILSIASSIAKNKGVSIIPTQIVSMTSVIALIKSRKRWKDYRINSQQHSTWRSVSPARLLQALPQVRNSRLQQLHFLPNFETSPHRSQAAKCALQYAVSVAVDHAAFIPLNLYLREKRKYLKIPSTSVCSLVVRRLFLRLIFWMGNFPGRPVWPAMMR